MATRFNKDKQDWNWFRDWELKPEEKVEPCEYAKRFIAWRDEVCKKPLASSNVILLNQTVLKVAKRYYEFYASVPDEHKRCLGDTRHICIFQVFIETMQLFKDHELSIDPPPLFEPAPPPPAQIVKIDAVELGEFRRK